MSILCTKQVVATGCQCSPAAVIRRDITNDSWRSFCFCSAELRIGPHGPSRGCLLSANIIMLFVCVWRSCVCSCFGHIHPNFMPSLELCQVCLQPPVSPCFSSTTPHTAVSVASLFFSLIFISLAASQFLFCFPAIASPPPSFYHTVICTLPTTRPPPSSLLSTLLCVGVKLRLYFPFWYCIVNALLHPIQLRCCGNTV